MLSGALCDDVIFLNDANDHKFVSVFVQVKTFDAHIVNCVRRKNKCWGEFCKIYFDLYYHCMSVPQNKISIMYLFMICSNIYFFSVWHHSVTE